MLPERTVAILLQLNGGEMSIKDIKEKLRFSNKELSIALGWFVKKDWGRIDKEKGIVILNEEYRL